MIIYQVYKNDPECPELLFRTADKNKADSFIEQYNSQNINDKIDPFIDKYLFSLQCDTDHMEAEADKVISSYSIKKIYEIRYDSVKEKAEVMNVYNSFQESVKVPYEQIKININGIYFVDLQEDIDINLTSEEVTEKTKAIVKQYLEWLEEDSRS